MCEAREPEAVRAMTKLRTCIVVGLALVGCEKGPVAQAPVARPTASAAPKPPPALPSDAENEKEWHDHDVRPLTGTGVNGALPLYPVVLCRTAATLTLTDDGALITCGGLVRVV